MRAIISTLLLLIVPPFALGQACYCPGGPAPPTPPTAQTLTFPAPANQTYAGTSLTVPLTATASSGLAPTYTVTAGNATVSGSTMTVTGAGMISLLATQTGNSTYSAATPIYRTFNSVLSGYTMIPNVQNSGTVWDSWGQFPPNYVDCPAPCPQVSWVQTFNLTTPSVSGLNSTSFSTQPTIPYADVLFSAQLIGTNNPAFTDAGHTLLPNLTGMVYDTYFFLTNLAATAIMEFDISLYPGSGVSMIYGHQCNREGDGDWDIWHNTANSGNGAWFSTGQPCNMVLGWNHVTLMMSRTVSTNVLLYKTITLNGTTYNINYSDPASTAPASFYGLTANYQQDGNASGAANLTYADDMSISYSTTIH